MPLLTEKAQNVACNHLIGQRIFVQQFAEELRVCFCLLQADLIRLVSGAAFKCLPSQLHQGHVTNDCLIDKPHQSSKQPCILYAGLT